MSPTAASALLLMLLTSPADAEEPADVREQVEAGTWVNWTTMRVEVQSSGLPSGTASSRKVVEMSARRPIANKIERAISAVRVDADHRVSDLQADPDLGDTIAARATRWSVSEARYYAAGRVELVGELSIGELLKPWTLDRAPAGPAETEQPRHSGVVIDARGFAVERAFAPRVLAADAVGVLHGGLVWKDRATEAVPVIYVLDPAHPAAARAGDHPLFVRATAALGCDLVLDAESSITYRTGLQGSRAVGEGTVVIVVDG